LAADAFSRSSSGRAVPAIVLGEIERGVSAAHDLGQRLARAVAGGADRQRDGAEIIARPLAHDAAAHHGLADLVGAHHRIVEAGLRQHDGELLAAIARRRVATLDAVAQGTRNTWSPIWWP
jgi:hypothetical protein